MVREAFDGMEVMENPHFLAQSGIWGQELPTFTPGMSKIRDLSANLGKTSSPH